MAFLKSFFSKEAKREVLVVDDDADIRSVMAAALKQGGFAVHEARNGLEALEAARKRKPALILMDIAMPEMNGQELLARLREDEETREIPVIMITALSSETEHTDAEWARKMEVDGFISKPFDPMRVLELVQSILERRGD
ncbi:response regulator [Candidatus Sumerlaeota bacterium]|nr:response regulator [Candidatus Sumerlaeota bacterium]